MKKNILIIGLLAVFILGSFTFALASLLPQRDNVQFSETVLYGDPKAAEGLTLNYKNHCDYHLFWDTTWTIGTPPETAVTSYQFSLKEMREEYTPPLGVNLETSSFITYYIQDVPYGLQNAFDALAADTPAGEDNFRNIKISDYYEYYPISGTIQLKDHLITLNEAAFFQYTNGETINTADENTRVSLALSQFFRIPVLPRDTMAISITKDSSGYVATKHTSHGSDTSYYMEMTGAAGENAYYFTFQTSAPRNEVIDTSLIPGGYGIYCLPLDHENNTVKEDQLAMVYSLPASAEIVSMNVSSNQTSLFLFTKETDGFYFAEIDLDTMETLQRLRINDPYLLYDDMMHVTDDYFAFYGVDDSDTSGYRIFSRDENGQFKFDFLIPSPIDEGRNYFNFYSDATFAYDGNRAALTGLAVSASHWSCVFTAAVYDETGMLYCGEYSTGQNCREDSWTSRNCVPVANRMAEISWS